MTSSIWIGIGAVSGFLGVVLGAFGAHGLRARLAPELLAIYQTAAQYQMYHALALVALGVWGSMRKAGSLGTVSDVVGWSFFSGTILFSGSLYALSITGVRALGAITPVGGLCFMVGWLAFAFAALKT